MSAGFQALTMSRRESGFFRMPATTAATWSIVWPSRPGQERHWWPYTGPRSPCSSAHSFQIVTPRSCRYPTLVPPVRNQSSSCTIDGRCTFFVVSSGNPSARSNRIWWPNTLSVPVPVRSSLRTPVSRIRRTRSWYACTDAASRRPWRDTGSIHRGTSASSSSPSGRGTTRRSGDQFRAAPHGRRIPSGGLPRACPAGPAP